MQENIKKKIIKRIVLVTLALGIVVPCVVVFLKKCTERSVDHINQFFTPKTVRLEIKNIYSSTITQQITSFLNKQTAEQSLLDFEPDTFYQALKEKFPIVKEFEWEYEVPQTLHLTIVGTIPYCIVNNTFVLGNKHRLFSEEVFEDTDLENLPHITIDSCWISEKLDPMVYDFVHKIPTDYWTTYNIAYHAAHNIELIPHKAICRCRIFTDEKSFFEKRKFDALSGLFQDLCDHGFITTKMLQSKKTPLAFDFRIKNEIIVKFYESIRRGRGS